MAEWLTLSFIADSLCHAVQTNTTVQSKYSPAKIKKEKRSTWEVFTTLFAGLHPGVPDLVGLKWMPVLLVGGPHFEDHCYC